MNRYLAIACPNCQGELCWPYPDTHRQNWITLLEVKSAPAYMAPCVGQILETRDLAYLNSCIFLDQDAIRARIQEYEEAGASHIAVSPYNPAGMEMPWDLLEALAP